MSKRNKIVAMVLVLALAIGASVYGTLAYLQEPKQTVNNTFVSGSLVSDEPGPNGEDPDFVLVEHEANKNDDGSYALEDNEVPGNDYIVLPGVNLPKDPFVRVNVDKNLTAYLFIEVIDSLPEKLTYSIDDANWAPLKNGENEVEKDGHPIWVYKGAPFTGFVDEYDTNIIAGKTITVPEDFNVETLNSSSLAFNAYLCQAAGFDGAFAAWDACFAKNPGA